MINADQNKTTKYDGVGTSDFIAGTQICVQSGGLVPEILLFHSGVPDSSIFFDVVGDGLLGYLRCRPCAMVGGTGKRSSDDGASGSAKKKKVLKEKRDADVPKAKTTTPDGDTRQKRAFFAFFGKKFDDQTVSTAVDSKKPAVENEEETNDDCLILPLAESIKTVVVEKPLHPVNSRFVKYASFFC